MSICLKAHPTECYIICDCTYTLCIQATHHDCEKENCGEFCFLLNSLVGCKKEEE